MSAPAQELIEYLSSARGAPPTSPIDSLLLRASGARRLTLLLDGDRPGREATGELLPRPAADFFVRVVHLPDGAQPDTVPEQFLLKFLAVHAHS
jgi:DNA primase